MIQYYKNINRQTLEIEQAETANWINVSPPFQSDEIDDLSRRLDIPHDFLTDTLDIEERSRYEEEEGVRLLILKTPVENKSLNESDAYYITIPIAIIITERNQVVTVNSFENVAIRRFLTTFAKRHPERPNMMVLKVFEKVVMDFMEVLKTINHRRNLFEQKLYDSNRNEELLALMRTQKSLVYLLTALRSNELLLMKMERTNFLNCDEDEAEFLSDLIIETSQAKEMADNYTNILSSTLDAYASIINNNMNLVMKRLTSITIMISLPTLVASFFGMNVLVPFQDQLRGFWIALGISALVAGVVAWIFNKKRWF
jgi:magnesium transporter